MYDRKATRSCKLGDLSGSGRYNIILRDSSDENRFGENRIRRRMLWTGRDRHLGQDSHVLTLCCDLRSSDRRVGCVRGSFSPYSSDPGSFKSGFLSDGCFLLIFLDSKHKVQLLFKKNAILFKLSMVSLISIFSYCKILM